MSMVQRLLTRRMAFAATSVLLGATLVSAGTFAKPALRGAVKQAASRSIFERRILPILQAKNPSSCSECHLSGVDLKQYIGPSEAITFASLRDQGLIDSHNPDNSRILRFIRMSRPTTSLVTQKVRAEEYKAFRDWIAAAVTEPTITNVPSLAAPRRTGPSLPVAVIRHARIDSVVASFERNIWSQEGRCMGCHRAGTPTNDEYVKKYGSRVAWFVTNSPEQTMARLVSQGDVNVSRPEESLLLLKPMNKVSHGGGLKMLYGDTGYKMFRAWLDDYAASVHGSYRSASDLPAVTKETLVNAHCALCMWGAPSEWWGQLMRADVYAWNTQDNAWAGIPIATGERRVEKDIGGRAGATNLFMFYIVPTVAAGDGSDERGPLASGRYLLKYYCDTAGTLNLDYTVPTNAEAFDQGKQEVDITWNNWNKPIQIDMAVR